MRYVKINGFGVEIPKSAVKFDESTRYRVENETHIDMLVASAEKALVDANMAIDDIDCIVASCVVPVQPIPCTASLVHERIAKHTNIPAFDINSTCTSFVTAIDTISYMIEGNRYKNVLIVSGDISSKALNKNQKESFELFGDGCVAIVLSKDEEKKSGIIYSEIKTYSEYAHSTEIIGGGTHLLPYDYTQENSEKYKFNMEGIKILRASAKILNTYIEDLETNANITLDDIDMFVPHQASSALKFIMKKIKVPTEKYIDIVDDYGNMVSASIPFAFYKGIELGKISRGDTVVLVGTAAGLTVNTLVLKY